MNAYGKDILRAIKKGSKRFLSLMLITALGVTTMTGLRAACSDLRYSADEFFDAQSLFDINVVSTLGLTDEDLEVLSDLDGVENAEGIYSEKVYLQDSGKSVEMTVLTEKGINIPYIVDGRLPLEPDEVAVAEKYFLETGRGVGDTITIEEDIEEPEDTDEEAENPNFPNRTFEITGVVVDIKDVNKAEGASAFRSPASSDYVFFVTKDAVDADVFTSIYLRLEGTEDMMTYSDEYEDKVKTVTSVIEAQIKEKREQARYDEIIGEANEEIAEAEAEMNDEFAKADEEFAKAWRDISDGKNQLASGKRELTEQEQSANDRFNKAWADIEQGKQEIEDGKAELAVSEKELADGEAELAAAKADLEKQQSETNDLLAASRAQLVNSREQAEQEYSRLTQQTGQLSAMLGAGWPEEKWQSYTIAASKIYMSVVTAQTQISQLEQQMESLDKGSAEYAEMNEQLEAAKIQLQQAQNAVSGQMSAAQSEFTAALTPVITAAVNDIDVRINNLDPALPGYSQQLAALQQQKTQLQALPAQLLQAGMGMGQLEAASAEMTGRLNELNKQQQQADKSFADGFSRMAEIEKELANGRSKLRNGAAELERGAKELADGEAELKAQEESARSQIAEGRQTIAESEKELADGEAELKEQEAEYLVERADAEQELADAKKELEDIDTAQWYIQDRSALGGYNNIDTDSSSIEALGTVFPVIFLIVAVLISLTTITRKVEEERGLIGTYKALGFTNGEIRRKYMLFALSAGLLGGVIGDICGFVILPRIIFSIFDVMYTLPEYLLKFDFIYGTAGILLFVVCVVSATAYACANELRQMPAKLMRPKAPKAGSRVILEHIPFIWDRFSFLNKVTARNLFRYKKRLFMTVLGIMGCTALLVCGFAIKDSVTELLPNQYERIYKYDLQASADEKNNDSLIEGLDTDENVEEFINVRMETAKLKNNSGQEESLQIMVMPDGVNYDSFMYLENTEDKEVTLDGSGVYITENAARILGISVGDSVPLQDMELIEKDVVINDIVKNYLGNKVYMSQQAYEELFGEYKPNSVMINFTEKCTDHEAYSEMLGDREGVVSSVSMVAIKRDFSKSFSLVNVAVYIIISLAAGLAVVVLFTLSTTNISERERELATIKVLGFHDREVHSYVNKETFILTFMGILLGLPVGQYLGGLLTNALRMPAVHFAVTIYTVSYVYSVGIALVFAIAVNMITNRILNKIDPVEALKSVE